MEIAIPKESDHEWTEVRYAHTIFS